VGVSYEQWSPHSPTAIPTGGGHSCLRSEQEAERAEEDAAHHKARHEAAIAAALGPRDDGELPA